MSSPSKPSDHNTSKKPCEMDQYIGGRLRLWRRTMDVDANSLAASVGVTYQQLQKYEKGMNRISATRLYAIARKLNVPIDYFYQEAELRSAGPTDTPGGNGEAAKHIALLTDGNGTDLLKCFVSIKDPDIRKAVLNLVRSIVTGEGCAQPEPARAELSADGQNEINAGGHSKS
jgi:transcriptional regulator with XRE-family HTH domain